MKYRVGWFLSAMLVYGVIGGGVTHAAAGDSSPME